MKVRNYGIDLARIVFMYMVCIQHIIGQGGILDACIKGSIQYNVYYSIDIFATCAVDGFALISGYMASNKPNRYEKIIDMWFQAFFYSAILTQVLTLTGYDSVLTLKEYIKCIMPVTFKSFWYFTAYFCLFFSMPILNGFIFSMDKRDSKMTIAIMFILFSVMGTLGDPFTSNGGYSAIWLMVLYILGALARCLGILEKTKSLSLVLTLMFCNLLMCTSALLCGTSKFISYLSPFNLISAFVILILFSRLKLSGGYQGLFQKYPRSYLEFIFFN